MTLTFDKLLTLQHCPPALSAELEGLHERVEKLVVNYIGQPGVFDGSDLNDSYWDAVTFLLKARVFDADGASLNMIDREELLANFGLLDERLLPPGVTMDRMIRAQLQPAVLHVPVLYFSEILEDTFSTIVNAEEYYQAKTELERSNAAYKQLKSRLQSGIDARDALIASASNASQLQATLRSLDEAFPYFSRLSVMMTDKRFQKTEKVVQEYKRLRRAYDSLKTKERELLAAAGLPESTQESIRDTNARHTDVVRMQLSIELLREKVQSLKGNTQVVNRNARFLKLMETVREIQKTSQGFSQRILRVGLVQVLNKDIDVNHREAMELMVKEVLRIDTRFGKRLKDPAHRGLQVCILPGIGEALAEPRRRRIWVPLMFAFEKGDSLIAALGQHRYDSFPECGESYRALPHVSDMKSDVQVRRQFGEDYSVFIRNTAKGFRKLPADVHAWFVDYVLRGKAEEEQAK